MAGINSLTDSFSTFSGLVFMFKIVCLWLGGSADVSPQGLVTIFIFFPSTLKTKKIKIVTSPCGFSLSTGVGSSINNKV